ncbi:MAG: hypothetical protein ACXAB6_02170, partial [Candidatus Thorarchaeota archaeon]
YREDIIVGSWDGKVRCFEYDDHSNYPFSEEHWISFREVWDSGDAIDGRVYTIGYGDTNFNGLPEIIAGTREGRVYVFENDGVHLMINGEPFPLINDNNYELVWTSQNYTWTPILDMTVGELDGTPGEEIALVAQGQGVFVLNWDELFQRYDYHRVFRPWDAWQTSDVAPWRLDFWADSIVRANNVSYFLSNGTEIPEPITYTYVGAGMFDPDAEAYPYNTGMANASDFSYSYFRADLAPNATALVDFGKDEEGTGSASADWDIVLKFSPINPPSVFNLNLSIGQSSTDLTQINRSRMFVFGNYLYVDVDDVLSEKKWDWFRYLEITAFNGQLYLIDSIELFQVYTQLTTALTVTIGPLPQTFNLFGPPDEADMLIVSTVVGTFYGFDWNTTLDEYDLIWDSSRDDFFSIGTNVWDMIYVGSYTKYPIWLQGGIEYSANPSNLVYSHWSLSDMEFWEVAGSTYPHEVIVVDDAHAIRVFQPNGPDLLYDLDKTFYFSTVEAEITAEMGATANATVETAVLQNPFTFPESLAVVGVFDPTFVTDDIYLSDVGTQIADIWFLERADTTVPYETLNYKTMADLDDTGDIVQALSNAKTVPRIEFVDYDGDFDLDMILSTGFLYYCENIGYQPDGWSRFRMVKGFFESLNTNEEMNDYWGQPETWDINQDGVTDLILSYDTRRGGTCYINKGTNDNPEWVKTKKLFSNTRPETNLKFNEYTGLRMAPLGWGLMQDWWYDINSDLTTFQNAEYTMMAFKTDTNSLGVFWPVYDQSASYIVATYPTVSRYELAVQTEGGNNFGYHIMESWNTEDDIEDWTLSVTTGDVDADGHGEVIVGDYDNNIYIFEHMLNNTYKRAFRSFDINHTEVSNSSPYFWEELEGISGTFNRVIWDHVEHILADCDLDGDGFKELIAAAGLQVYVFEDTGIDDTYDLAYTFDMRNNPYVEDDEWEHVTVVTAIGAGDDYDLNGENELLVAVGPFLFVYNIPYDTWTYQEEYFMRSGTPEGRYYLLGNGAHEDFEKAWITTMALCDVDEDGYREIIIGGKVNVTQIRQDGFLKVYEWKGVSFVEVWEAPPEVTTWNAVTSIALDDQDYDSKQEIIIGHNKGFDIWEWTGDDDNYTKVDVVTSSPNYPIVPLQTARQGNDITNELLRQTDRGDSDLAYMSWAPNAPIMCVFTQLGSSGQDRLYYKIFDTVNEEWGAAVQIYSGEYGMGPANLEEYEPSLFLHTDGTLYLVWRADIHPSGTDNYNLYISYWNPGGGNWVTPAFVMGSYYDIHFPSLFQYSDGSLGLVITNNAVHIAGYLNSTAWNIWDVSGNVITFKNWVYYDVYSTDIINIPGSGGGYALAISGRNRTLAKTDLDIFVAISNTSFIWDDSPMYQATSSYNNEVNPDLGLLAAPESSLMVVYESVEADIEDRIQMSYSNTYMMWRQSEPLATLPPYIIRTEHPGGQVVYGYNETVRLYAPVALCPSILGIRGGGFMQMHTFDFFTRISTLLNTVQGKALIREFSTYDEMKYVENADLLWGINPSSRFTHFNIRGVTELDVGDTDGDNRREVIVGFDNRAGVYELTHSNVGGEIMEHEEVWLSYPFEFDVTGVSVYDSNGNEFEEIMVSCERGDVFVFEVDDTVAGRVHLMYSEEMWTYTGGNPAAESGHQHTIEVFDLDADGKDEIIRGELGGVVRAIDDDGTQMWSNGDYPGAPYHLAVGNLTSLGQPYVAVTRWDGYITIIDGSNGAATAHLLMADFVPSIGYVAIGDVEGSPNAEVVASDFFGNVVALTPDGNVVWNVSIVPPLNTFTVTLGNFSGKAQLDVALGWFNGSISVLHGNNGSMYYHYNASLGASILLPEAVDINRDGIDDILTGEEHLFAFDPNNQSVIYNSTIYPEFDIQWLFVEDYDDDSQFEAICVTKNVVYLEEMTSGRVVWEYEPDTEVILDAMLGRFVDGRLGIGLATDDGWVVALDALSGVPVFFDLVPLNEYNEMAVGDFDGDGIDEIVGSDDSSGDLRAVTLVEPWIPAPLSAFDYWSLYWNETSPTWITGIWTYDIDNDGIDDYVRSHSDGSLALFNPVYPAVEWFRGLDAFVHDVKFAEFTGDAIIDLLVITEKSGSFFVLGLDGTSGAEIPSMTKVTPSGTRINLIAVGNLDSGSAGTEYAVILTDAVNYTWVEIFLNSGAFKAVSSVNASNFWPTDVVVGHFGN